MARVLTPEYEELKAEFQSIFGVHGNCSCHISPPCGSCMHPGNPHNLEEIPEAWMEEEDDPQ